MTTVHKRSAFEIKLGSLLHRTLYHTMSDKLPVYVVTEYPKSGGSWVAKMMADLLGLPFYQQRLPEFRSQLGHGHYLYSPNLHNVFVQVRDGRDVMVSFYYHLMFLYDTNQNWMEHKVATSELGIKEPGNVKDNLPVLIEYLFNKNKVVKFTWTEFVESWINQGAPIIKYEDLLTKADVTLHSALEFYGLDVSMEKIQTVVNKNSFENMAKRPRGQENPNSFMRKGISGDWKTVFSPEARQIFHHYAGQTLIKLGYETDESWVSDNTTNATD